MLEELSIIPPQHNYENTNNLLGLSLVDISIKNNMIKPTHCQDNRCRYMKNLAKYLHSTILYNKELYEKTRQEYYWACENCVDEDHLRYESGRQKQHLQIKD